MAFMSAKGRGQVAALVLASEAMLTLGFNTAGLHTPDQLPHRNPHEERRRIEEHRREAASHRLYSDEIRTL